MNQKDYDTIAESEDFEAWWQDGAPTELDIMDFYNEDGEVSNIILDYNGFWKYHNNQTDMWFDRNEFVDFIKEEFGTSFSNLKRLSSRFNDKDYDMLKDMILVSAWGKFREDLIIYYKENPKEIPEQFLKDCGVE